MDLDFTQLHDILQLHQLSTFSFDSALISTNHRVVRPRSALSTSASEWPQSQLSDLLSFSSHFQYSLQLHTCFQTVLQPPTIAVFTLPLNMHLHSFSSTSLTCFYHSNQFWLDFACTSHSFGLLHNCHPMLVFNDPSLYYSRNFRFGTRIFATNDNT